MRKIIKINWNKPGGTASTGAKPTAKVSIPAAMIKAMQMYGDENLVMTLEDGYIKIERDPVRLSELIDETIPSDYTGQDLHTLEKRIRNWMEKLQDGRSGSDRRSVRGNLKDDLSKMAGHFNKDGKNYQEEMRKIFNITRRQTMEKYVASLTNAQGATFDTGTFDSIEEAKEWAKGRGQTFEFGEWKDYVVRIRKSDDIYDYIEEYHER